MLMMLGISLRITSFGGGNTSITRKLKHTKNNKHLLKTKKNHFPLLALYPHEIFTTPLHYVRSSLKEKKTVIWNKKMATTLPPLWCTGIHTCRHYSGDSVKEKLMVFGAISLTAMRLLRAINSKQQSHSGCHVCLCERFLASNLLVYFTSEL